MYHFLVGAWGRGSGHVQRFDSRAEGHLARVGVILTLRRALAAITILVTVLDRQSLHILVEAETEDVTLNRFDCSHALLLLLLLLTADQPAGRRDREAARPQREAVEAATACSSRGVGTKMQISSQLKRLEEVSDGVREEVIHGNTASLKSVLRLSIGVQSWQ